MVADILFSNLFLFFFCCLLTLNFNFNAKDQKEKQWMKKKWTQETIKLFFNTPWVMFPFTPKLNSKKKKVCRKERKEPQEKGKTVLNIGHWPFRSRFFFARCFCSQNLLFSLVFAMIFMRSTIFKHSNYSQDLLLFAKNCFLFFALLSPHTEPVEAFDEKSVHTKQSRSLNTSTTEQQLTPKKKCFEYFTLKTCRKIGRRRNTAKFSCLFWMCAAFFCL